MQNFRNIAAMVILPLFMLGCEPSMFQKCMRAEIAKLQALPDNDFFEATKYPKAAHIALRAALEDAAAVDVEDQHQFESELREAYDQHVFQPQKTNSLYQTYLQRQIESDEVHEKLGQEGDRDSRVQALTTAKKAQAAVQDAKTQCLEDQDCKFLIYGNHPIVEEVRERNPAKDFYLRMDEFYQVFDEYDWQPLFEDLEPKKRWDFKIFASLTHERTVGTTPIELGSKYSWTVMIAEYFEKRLSDMSYRVEERARDTCNERGLYE